MAFVFHILSNVLPQILGNFWYFVWEYHDKKTHFDVVK